jgi:hypothetical protein
LLLARQYRGHTPSRDLFVCDLAGPDGALFMVEMQAGHHEWYYVVRRPSRASALVKAVSGELLGCAS